MKIAFTGPRTLTKEQERKIYQDFCYFITTEQADWHVGDALGLDDFVRRAHPYFYSRRSEGYKLGNLTVYEVQGTQPYHFAQRSKRMIDAIAASSDPWLYAFPNKPCPDGCKPSANPTGKGSGTWLTIAYAKHRGLQIYLFPLSDFSVPDWLEQPTQLSLF